MHTEKEPSRNEPEGAWLNAGEYLKRELARQGVTVQELASKIGHSTSSIYNVMGSGKRSISSGLARKLADVLGGTVEFWLEDRFPNRATPPDVIQRAVAHVPGILVDRRLVEFNNGEEDGFSVSPIDEDQYQGTSIDLKMGSFIVEGFETVPKKERNSLFWMHQVDLEGSRPTSEMREIVEELRASGVVCRAEVAVPKDGFVYVVAGQFIRMGPRFVGLLGQTTEGNLRGMIVHCGHQVDPGFNGPLIFRVKNDSGRVMRLKRGEPLAALTIVALPEPVEKRYGKNPMSQIAGVLDALRAALAEHIEISDDRAGWQMRFGDEVLSGVNREGVISGFFAWLEGQVRANNPSLCGILAGAPIDSEGVASLGHFLNCTSDTVDAALALADNPRMQFFGMAISNLTGGNAGLGNEAILKVLGELRILATGSVGFDIARRDV